MDAWGRAVCVRCGTLCPPPVDRAGQGSLSAGFQSLLSSKSNQSELFMSAIELCSGC